MRFILLLRAYLLVEPRQKKLVGSLPFQVAIEPIITLVLSLDRKQSGVYKALPTTLSKAEYNGSVLGMPGLFNLESTPSLNSIGSMI
jgi:hypothetical protein